MPLILGMPFEEYKAAPGVNWSTLKELRRSPLAYHHRLTTPREDSDAFAFGRATHTAVLEPDLFPLQYVVFKGDRRTKEWKEFKVAHESETILSADEYETVLAIRDAIRSHPLAAPYLNVGAAEQSIFWKDEKTGVECKGRIDWVSESKRAFVDLKTTRNIEARLFGMDAEKFGYHCQSAFYSDGYLAAAGVRFPTVIIAVDSVAPHDVAVYQVDDDALWAGAEQYHECLQRLVECRSVDVWPGMYSAEQVLQLPPWSFPDGDGFGLKINGEAV